VTKKAFLHAYAALVTDDAMAAGLEQDDGFHLHAHHALLTRLRSTTHNDTAEDTFLA